MHLIRGKLRNLAISPLPLSVSTPSTAASLEEVPPLPMVVAEIEDEPPTQPTSATTGYFLRSGKNHLGGLGKDSLPVPRGRGRKSFLAKAQSRAQKDLSEGKQLSIERALRAVQAQKKGQR